MKPTKVPSFIDAAIVASGKTHEAIAEEVGYTSISVISMIRNGKTHLPINKLRDFARALKIDELELLEIVLEERNPEIYQILAERGVFPVLKKSVVENDEGTKACNN